MLYIDVPLSAKLIEEWVLPDGSSKHNVAIDRLIQLRIMIETVDRKKETTYRVNQTFQVNLQKHIVHGGTLPREPMPTNITVRRPSLQDLEAYAAEQWECFLLHLISSTQAERTTNFSSSMMKIFQRGLLSQRDKEAPKLTKSGFQFLLMDTNAQLWYIIREYITSSEERGLDSADLISFFLELSFHVTGDAYNMNTLTDTQINVIKDLADLGLAKLQQGRKESWFIPTKLATNLSISLSDLSSRKQERGLDSADLISFFLELSFHVTGDAYNMNTLTDTQINVIKDLADLGLAKLQQGRKESWFIPTKLATNLSISLSDLSSRKQGFVVVETNFRVYAYSSSKLHCEILRLFSRVEYQLPNLIVGAITKESLYNAFENGIMAEQIISFLQQNAHPRVAERMPSVPENVTDQIRLWESDMNRVEMAPAYYYDEFPSREVYEAACDYARQYGGLLWDESKRMRLVVKAEIHMHMREFLRREK
ncbi:RNA polymerase II transcription factor B subunit like [Actinidia chinensis var. chinensis]|uniref:RNA polymerase II transcription factor B subunit 2 n=1 Tax=Actinidia chinensis var. chinensis TaxID=1590841 RepID=A0A2R6PXV2_ACTCC|nr:RNA polymerase II transcription factor B subunit like [Actinidia chinensis var. chinensis]